MTGLDIDLESFKKLKAIDRDAIIYKNVLNTRTGLKDYKFHRKIHYAWLSALTTATVFLIKVIMEVRN